MKPLLHLPALAFLLLVTAVSPCFAMMDIEFVSPARAKELGMEIRSQPAGPDAVWVELEFKAAGELKDVDRVSMEIWEAGQGKQHGKLQLSSSLKEEKSEPGKIRVVFTADRAQLDKITLRVVTGAPMARVGHDLRLKDFVHPEKAPAAAAPAATPIQADAPTPATSAPPASPATPPAAAPRSTATPDEEARFVTAVQKAFERRDASGLDALTCWDGVTDKDKKHVQSTNAALVAEKDAVFDFKLVAPDLKFIDRDRTEGGVTYRSNLPVTKQLDMMGRDPKDKKPLLKLCCRVGEKDGKLLFVESAPVK